MANVSLSIAYALPTRSTSDGLLLEQEPWGGTGKVTKLNLVKALSSAVYGNQDDNAIDCGVDGNGYHSYLNAYPYDQGMTYEIGITHGTLGEMTIQEVEVREMVSFSLTTEESVKYPIQEFISAEWSAETWDGDGAVASDPTISISGNTVTISAARYGTVVVTYKTIRHSRSLTVPAREEAVENVFDSYGWARWDGGVELLKLDPPEGAEEDYANDIDCMFGSYIGGVSSPDDPNEPTCGRNSKERYIDYCTGQEIIY